MTGPRPQIDGEAAPGRRAATEAAGLGRAAGKPTGPVDGGLFGPLRREGVSIGRTLALLTLLVATLLQLRSLTADFIWPRLERGWEVRGYTAWERSALLSEGEDFLGFISFLRAAIPETGKVVFPPHSYISKAGVFTELGFLKYFLFPRQVLNCGEPVEECVRSLTGPSSYIVSIGGFPPPDAAEEVKDYIPYQEGKGVYAPR